MIGKVIPGEIRGTFFGFQSAAANLLSSVGALVAGVLLDRLHYPQGFLACFSLTAVMMVFSYIFMGMTKESSRSLPLSTEHVLPLWKHVKVILARDADFRWFLISRTLAQFGTMAFAFYTVYAVRQLQMSELEAGAITSVLLITQVIANPLFGWIADRWSRKWVMVAAAISCAASALLAFWAPSLSWFYPVVIFQGLANTVYWTIGLAYSMEFGEENERPTYVGMANTLVAPSAVIAPLLGGWLADSAGYPATFLLAAFFSIITGLVLTIFVHDRRSAAAATV
jgi:MFS family permease